MTEVTRGETLLHALQLDADTNSTHEAIRKRLSRSGASYYWVRRDDGRTLYIASEAVTEAVPMYRCRALQKSSQWLALPGVAIVRSGGGWNLEMSKYMRSAGDSGRRRLGVAAEQRWFEAEKLVHERRNYRPRLAHLTDITPDQLSEDLIEALADLQVEDYEPFEEDDD